MLRLLWRLIRFAVTLVLLVILVPLAGLSYGFLSTGPVATGTISAAEPPPAHTRNEIVAAISNYERPEESTWLTYPEWSIVYAARDYAAYVAENRESGFPYWAYVGRYWKDYAIVIRATERYPFNTANHVMLTVIGTSHTIELGVQSLYENTVGRLTEFLSGKPVGEDEFQAAVAAEYAQFLDQVPWYRFDNKTKRAGLWQIEPARGIAAIRSWERKIAFGLSYSIKQAYAWVIRKGLQASGDPAMLDIHVWAKGPVGAAVRGEKDTGIVLQFGEDGAVFVTPRYQVFTDRVPRLIGRGLQFVEIGGNDEILVTVLSPQFVQAPDGAQLLFAYALPAQPDRIRSGLTIAVRDLHVALPALIEAGAELEHLYDY